MQEAPWEASNLEALVLVGSDNFLLLLMIVYTWSDLSKCVALYCLYGILTSIATCAPQKRTAAEVLSTQEERKRAKNLALHC